MDFPPPKHRTESRLTGVPVSPGIARASAVLTYAGFIAPEPQEIEEGEVRVEVERFHEALKATRAEIRGVQHKIAGESKDGASIFDAHVLMLEDRVVLDEVEREIAGLKVCAEAVYFDVVRRYIDLLRRKEAYFRDRVVDFEDVARRVIRHLTGDHPPPVANEPHVAIAHDLTPSDTAAMDRSRVLGFATEAGSKTSHTAIIARSLSIPAVVGVGGLQDAIRSGDEVIVDGYEGVIVIAPTQETIAEFETVRKRKAGLARKLEALRDSKCRTSDGREIILSANIELEEELPLLKVAGAEGVGLYRTEFIFLNHERLPSEQEQADAYLNVASAAGSDGAIIRTFDLGGDKLNSLEHRPSNPEPNPFLGWRGIRLSLSEEEFFKTQLRAILRASAGARVGVMFPLVSGLDELRRANEMLATCMRELSDEGVAFNPDIEVGAMIEVPSAALMADFLAPYVDFFSIGTNDLIQYTIAVDRVNERVADLYQPAHPAIIRLLRNIVGAAKTHGIWAGICGEMAGDVLYTPLLIGIGIDELSVAAGQLPRVKHAVRQLETSECAELVEDVALLADPKEITRHCRELAVSRYGELFA